MHFGRYMYAHFTRYSQWNHKWTIHTHHKHLVNLYQKIYIMCLVEIELNLSLLLFVALVLIRNSGNGNKIAAHCAYNQAV